MEYIIEILKATDFDEVVDSFASSAEVYGEVAEKMKDDIIRNLDRSKCEEGEEYVARVKQSNGTVEEGLPMLGFVVKDGEVKVES